MPEKTRIVDRSSTDWDSQAIVSSGRLQVSTSSEIGFDEGFGPFAKFADTNGDGSGTKNATGDYSGAVEEFYIQPPAGQVWRVNRVVITIRDSGAFRGDRYGALAAALTNGISLKRKDAADATLEDYTNGIPVKETEGWSRYCFDVRLSDYLTGDNFATVRWTFGKAGRAVQLEGQSRLVLELNDDFTGLIDHYFNFQGYRAS